MPNATYRLFKEFDFRLGDFGLGILAGATRTLVLVVYVCMRLYACVCVCVYVGGATVV